MNKLNIDVCPLCGGTRLEGFITCKDFSATGDLFELINCKECSFTHTQGVPEGHDMDRYYNTADYISHTDTKKGIINLFYHHTRKLMLARKARMVTKESHRETGKILDIGTGTGYFANAMARKGWEVDAIERNAGARDRAREKFGIEVKSDEAIDELLPGTYDVITLWHVMEHLEHLNETWEKLYELLAEKGILIVAAPNCRSYDAGKYGTYWAAYDVPRHLWHFTPATMRQFAIKHRFIMAARYPMPFDAFYISILSEKNKGSFCPVLKGAFTGLSAWFHTFEKKDKSSSVVYVFRKK